MPLKSLASPLQGSAQGGCAPQTPPLRAIDIQNEIGCYLGITTRCGIHHTKNLLHKKLLYKKIYYTKKITIQKNLLYKKNTLQKNFL